MAAAAKTRSRDGPGDNSDVGHVLRRRDKPVGGVSALGLELRCLIKTGRVNNAMLDATRVAVVLVTELTTSSSSML
jgi:hypothetical protein